jgi:hypothetical protein
MKKLVLVVAMAMVLGMGTLAQAALHDRGGGLIYDDDLNITWLQQPNNTPMTWAQAKTWAETLNYHDPVRNRDVTGWRLPTTPGTTFGYTNEGEMGHLYYDELHNVAGGPLANKGFFTDLQPYFYWSGSEYAADNYGAWDFNFDHGYQNAYWKDYYYDCALAVRSGDAAAVPLPGTVLLLGPALAGIGGLRRKLRRG